MTLKKCCAMKFFNHYNILIFFEFKRQQTRWNTDASFCWHSFNKTCVDNKYNNSKRESAKRIENYWKAFCLIS